MRKTTILAFATAVLAVVTVVTSLVRAEAGPIGKVSASPVVQVHSIDALKADIFDTI
jgi:hypothetical protein